MENLTFISLENSYNVRELGGISRMDGKVTKFHSFLRGDDISNLSDNDIRILLDYGVKAIVDLRSYDEVLNNPDPILRMNDIRYINISITSYDDNDNMMKVMKINPKEYLPSLYIDILKIKKNEIKKVFDFIAEEDKGCVLFHCTAGKDRTGIIATLLLGLSLVEKEDIILNYEISYDYLKRSIAIEKISKTVPIEIMYSKREYIEKAIDYIFDEYGSFRDYLLSTGIDEYILDKISNRL